MNKIYLSFMLLVLGAQACKRKETPLPQIGMPVFLFSGSIGTEAVSLQAGKEHMFLYTEFFKDNQNLITLKSYFAKDNCSNCDPYLSFELKDQGISFGSNLSVSIFDLLPPGSILNSYSTDSIISSTPVEQFVFIPEDSIGGNFTWDFGDGTTSNLISPTHIFTSGGPKIVRLIRQAFGSVDSISNTINADFNTTCRTQFTYQYDSLLDRYLFFATPPGFTYNWNFGNGSTGTSSIDSTSYPIPGNYVVTLTSTTPACTAVFRKKINQTGSFMPSANFNYSINTTAIITMLPRLNNKSFAITWKKNGQEYRSYKNISSINQSTNPIININSIETYSNNAAGNKTVKVSGSLDTYLYNYLNWQDSVRIKSDSLIFAFAYPG